MTDGLPQPDWCALHRTGASLDGVAEYRAFPIYYQASVHMLMEIEPWHQG
jgi:hypothetical protein